MTPSAPPGTPVIVGAGPEQLQQVRAVSRYQAATLETAVPNEVNYPVATAQDIQNFPQVVNIQAITDAPPGSAAWPDGQARAAALDGSAPS